jgi:hypothetical protein
MMQYQDRLLKQTPEPKTKQALPSAQKSVLLRACYIAIL